MAHAQHVMLLSNIQNLERDYQVNPNDPNVSHKLAICYTDLGTLLKTSGNFADGIRCYKKALVYNTGYADAWYNLGVAYAESGVMEEAMICYEVAVRVCPKHAEAHNNLGVIYKERGNLEKAEAFYRKALEIKPNYAQALNNMGVICTVVGNLDEGYEFCRRAIQADPHYDSAFNNLGVLYRDEGLVEKAIENYELCLKYQPDFKDAAQNRLIALNYLQNATTDYLFQEHANWGRRFQRHFQPCTAWPQSTPEPDRPLRIGYISPDFFTHSVSYFIEAPLAHHNKQQFTVICYANVGREDSKTERLKGYADQWRSVAGADARKVAELVKADKVDILVDLAGHTAGNRLDVMALKPAPVQVTWIGYPNTTGLPTVDYRFVDNWTDPEGHSQPHTEALYRIPNCFLCYTPPIERVLPPVDPKPAFETTGHITFGSFNNIAKMTEQVVQVWSEVLKAVPNSRLLMKCKPFSSARAVANVQANFERHGIQKTRLDLLPLVGGTTDHLRMYNKVDISLDTFPYAGTTTTCESLIMGVPCVTLVGHCSAQNVGLSLLSQIPQIKDLIAHSTQEFVSIAATLAQNADRLRSIRANLRQWMLSSPLCDGHTHTAHVEEAYRTIWRKWCAQTRPR